MFFHSWSGLARVPVVGVLAYAALVLFIRISGKRTLTKLNACDLVVTFASVRSRRIEGLVKAEQTPLLRDGRFLDAALTAQRVTRDELRSALRSGGYADVDGIGTVVLETDGSMSVLDAWPGLAAAPTLPAAS